MNYSSPTIHIPSCCYRPNPIPTCIHDSCNHGRYVDLIYKKPNPVMISERRTLMIAEDAANFITHAVSGRTSFSITSEF